MKIEHTDEETRHQWPQDCYVQGGGHGLVLGRSGSEDYTTAFVEAFPRDPDTFIRGEGSTIAEAETAAWDKLQRHIACPGHDFEPRGYTNGAGFCKHCRMFQSQVFTAGQLGLFCVECGTAANYTKVNDDWYCEQHARLARARRHQERLNGSLKHGSRLEELFDRLGGFNDDEDE